MSEVAARLPSQLQELQDRWLQLERHQQDEFYARAMAEPFARHFAGLPLEGAPDNMVGRKPAALVSLLGFSWQPVVLMAAWCRPKWMLVVGTDESLTKQVDGESVLSIISRVAGISRDAIEARSVGEPEEREVYEIIRGFLDKHRFSSREIFIDPTGGKKTMSAAAALAGYLVGARLVYVDYREYHGENRIPVPGTEYPRLLVNPLEVFGDLELRAVFDAFDRGDFKEAARLATDLAERLYERREADCLAELARGYGAWEDFNFKEARVLLGKAEADLDRFAKYGKWTWSDRIRETLRANLKALAELDSARSRIEQARDKEPELIEDGIPILLWYLASAEHRRATNRLNQAVLTVYAAMERYIRLCLSVDHGLRGDVHEDEVRERLDQDEYERAGRELFGPGYRPQEPQGRITFLNGAQLLRGLGSARLEHKDLARLKGLSSGRNACEYEHAWIPQVATDKTVQGFLELAKGIMARIAGGPDALRHRLEAYRLPRLVAAESEPES
jgi:CRISPR-associated protein (TIGR02710 family)